MVPNRSLSRALKGQSELSFAVSAMFLSGGLFAGLAATVFPPEHRPPLWVPVLVSGTGILISLLVLWRGRRLRIGTAAVMSGVYLLFLLWLIANSTTLGRATVAAMLSVVVIVLYAWFLPTKFARWVGYSALSIYAIIVVLRYPTNDAYLTAVALVSLSVLLTEVFGRFKANLEKSSLNDHLCDVWNRRGFEMLLEKEIRTVARTSEPLSLLYLDLDDFKAVNDTQGHIGGDVVLRQISDELVQGVRSGDSVARVGGDEFVVLLPRTGVKDAQRLAERLRGQVTACGWSFGVAEYRQGESGDEFIERSDLMMMMQKRDRARRSDPAPRTRSEVDEFGQ